MAAVGLRPTRVPVAVPIVVFSEPRARVSRVEVIVVGIPAKGGFIRAIVVPAGPSILVVGWQRFTGEGDMWAAAVGLVFMLQGSFTSKRLFGLFSTAFTTTGGVRAVLLVKGFIKWFMAAAFTTTREVRATT